MDIEEEGITKVLLMSVFCDVKCGKMAFCTQMELLIVWISWEDSLNVVVAARGGGKTKKRPPGGRCATVKSSLQSIHIAEVHFDFYKK